MRRGDDDHETLETIVDDQLWSVARRIKLMPGVRLPARMTIVRLDAARLALHSPVPIPDRLAEQIAALGDVAVIIAPNNYHHLYVAGVAARYPDAAVWAAPGLPKKRRSLTFRHLFGPRASPRWGEVLAPFFLDGAPKMDETVFVHRPTRTLIVADACFHVKDAPNWLSGLLFRATGVMGAPGQGRIWRAVVKDRAAMAASVRAVLVEDFDRLVVGHGEIIDTGGKAAFESANAWVLGA